MLLEFKQSYVKSLISNVYWTSDRNIVSSI